MADLPTNKALMPQNVINLLDKLTEKDKVIRDLRDKMNSKDELIRRLHKELAEEKRKRIALTAVLSSEGSEKKNHRKRKADSSIVVVQSNQTTKKKKPTKAARKRNDEWDERIRQLTEYKEKHGNLYVPRSYKENPQLSTFVDRLRQRYRLLKQGGDDAAGKESVASQLTPERIQQLEDLGFAWKVGSAINDLKWEEKYNALKEFKQKEGHTRVPNSCDSSLHAWIQNQRLFYKNAIQQKGKGCLQLSTERIARLQLLGFEWEVAAKELQAAWEAQFRVLITFKSEHGHCRVPREYKPNLKLAGWVREQRKNYKALKEGSGSRKGLSDERIRRLEEVGFEWRILPPRTKKGEETSHHQPRSDQVRTEPHPYYPPY